MSRFEISFDVTVRYPRWVAPEGASERLIEAWAAFSGDLTAYWEQYRDGILDRGKALVNELRFYEEICSLLDGRVSDLLVQRFGEPRRGAAEEPRLTLRWPPEGFDDVLRTPAPGGAAGRGGATGRAGGSGAAAAAAAAAGSSATAATDSSGSTTSSAPRLPPTTSARGIETFDEALETDFQVHGATELIFGLHHEGEVRFRDSYGRAERLAAGPLEPGTVFGFAGFTEVLIAASAASAASLASRGLLDLDAPISNYLRTLPEGLGSITMDQLLTHRAGLDNALPANGNDWDRELDFLRDNALFTAPGAVFSYSRYSFPLAARVIEGATGVELSEAVLRTVTS